MAIDSQSVKSVQFISSETGIDGNKRINGRKRTILVDTLGIPWAVKVTSAGLSDNQAGIRALESLKGKVPRLQKIIGDHGYKTTFIQHANKEYGWKIEIAPQRRAAKTRIDPRVCATEKPLAGRKVIWMAQFQAPTG
jgi:putative transposase